jgi:hypothetical protein
MDTAPEKRKGDYLEPISKIVDHTQGQGENRFKSRAYTLVFEHFESVFNTDLGC